jgi:hypothetical protein
MKMANQFDRRAISAAQREWRRQNPSTRYPLDYLIEPYVVRPIDRTIGIPPALTLGVVALVAVAAEIKNRRG